MAGYFGLASLVLGAIFGSFLNALSFRFNTGRSIASGRSRCMSCNHELSAADLVPIFSYLFLRGRCRYCGAKISLQYPLVEAAAALVSLLVFWQHPQPAAYAFWLVVWLVVLFIVIYDIRHTVIPWICSLLLAALALASMFFSFGWGVSYLSPTPAMLFAGPALALPLFLLSLVSRGRWMGWGDSGLELSFGWLLGPALGATAFLLAFWTGAAVGLLLVLFARMRWPGGAMRLTMSSEVPFAPFLALGAFLAYFLHVDLFSSLSVFW